MKDGVKITKITELIVTKALYMFLLWKQGYQIVTHQYNNYFGISDLFCVKSTLFTQELEIKLTKDDLLSELNDISEIIQGNIPVKKGSKYKKHFTYLITTQTKRVLKRQTQVPNYFSFVVPSTLTELAYTKLQNTNYGIIEFTLSPSGIFHFELIKSPKRIHSEKVNFDVLLKLSHRMSYVCEKHLNPNIDESVKSSS